jgi:uncharacterized protein YndB with AHSA1/START domain
MRELLAGSRGEVRIETLLPASAEAAFRCWTDPVEFRAWWRPAPLVLADVVFDVRPGGNYRIEMIRPDGGSQSVTGVYLEIRHPRRLVMSWRNHGSDADDGYESRLELDFADVEGGACMTLVHKNMPAAGAAMYDAGWTGVLAILQDHLV